MISRRLNINSNLLSSIRYYLQYLFIYGVPVKTYCAVKMLFYHHLAHVSANSLQSTVKSYAYFLCVYIFLSSMLIKYVLWKCSSFLWDFSRVIWNFFSLLWIRSNLKFNISNWLPKLYGLVLYGVVLYRLNSQSHQGVVVPLGPLVELYWVVPLLHCSIEW